MCEGLRRWKTCIWKTVRHWWQRRQWHPTPVLLPGKSHGWRSLVGCNPWGREESDMTERLHFHFSLLCIGEGNGKPLQCSCLENPRDKVAQSLTQLKWLSSSSSKTLMNAIENNTNGWKQIWCSWIQRINVVIDTYTFWTSPVAQTLKKLPAMQEIQVWWALGWEEPPEKGNGYLLQYSCLEKSMDRRAWQATVPGCKELDAAEWLILSFSFTQGNLQI